MESGDIVRKYGMSYRLKSFITESNYYGKTPVFEYWLCERSDGIEIVLAIQKVFEEITTERQDHCNVDRPKGQYINDKWEVNLLLDSYEEYINNQRNLLVRNSLLDTRRKDLTDLIDFLGSQYNKKGKSSTAKDPLRIGFGILRVHRISPSWCGHQVFKKWCADYPKEHLKMKQIIDEWKYKSQKAGNTATSI